MMSEEEDEFESLSSHDDDNHTYKQNGAVVPNDMSYISESLLPDADRQPLIGARLREVLRRGGDKSYQSITSQPPEAAGGSDDDDDETTLHDIQSFASGAKYTVEDAVENMGCGRFQAKFFFVCGLFSATDALEMLLLAVLSPVLKCEWYLHEWQVALLTTIVFIGMFSGSFLWGVASDKYGRFPVIYLCACLILYFGILTTFSPSYQWVLFLRCMIGFAFGGAIQSFTLMSEYIPSKYRAKLLILNSFNWAIGSTFEIWMASTLIPTLGWRWLVGASALPSAIAIVALWCLPESARYLVAANRKEEARVILQKASRLNGKELPEGELVLDKVTKRGSFVDLLARKYVFTTLILWLCWFAAAFSYYGNILLSSEILEEGAYCSADPKTDPGSFEVCHCKLHTKSDYTAMIVSTLGEFLAIPFNLITVDTIGRKATLSINYSGAALCFLLLQLCVNRTILTVIIFGLRAFTSGIFNIVYLYTAEVYPTTMRSLGLGTCSAVARIGSMSTPFIAQVLLESHGVVGSVWVYGSVCTLCCIAVCFLPYETLGREMPQTVESDTEVRNKPR